MTGFKVALVVGLFLFSTFANAKDIYVDPSATSGGDGSQAHPFNDLKRVVKSGSIMDGRLYLAPGNYGNLVISKKVPSQGVEIISIQKHQAVFSSIKILSSKNWKIDGVKVRYDSETPKKVKYLVEVGYNSRNITVQNVLVTSSENIEAWNKSDWNNKTKSGIGSYAPGVKILDNIVENIDFGILALGQNSVVSGNLINHFSGDGLRGLGDNSLFEKNVVKNCHAVNDNHDDGFQSWSLGDDLKSGGGVIRNVSLRDNLFIGNETEDNSPKCYMQGIGLYDGMYEGWEISNNIVVVDHWHGIIVAGAKNVRITNNTVFDPTGRKPGPAWIRVEDHKNGKKSTGNLVANNLANSFQFPDGGVLQLQNQIIRNPHLLFVDPDNHDYRLKPGARAIDAGMDGVGPKVDFYGNPRPSGEKTDVGAAEFVK
ncbi:hypothetical protein GUA87_06075 [Sneathiella sp. P13V-1]|uniref:choice-of-anchor Q domain-containing protein n=1 Tax=Sneathiella sp. P13V-1 TaxID=2697366 RepID=UPI00187B186A|nr:choice-of-anchor Q domain-containing protein [Sneathiella sp. P13V-1]MBE7636405.1 hypothetical protein [Sneathiella sp. P13V-1]